MAKTFREWRVEQSWLLPPSVKELVPAGDPSHFVRDLVREQLDLSAILVTYDEERGYPPYHPVMMTALLMYALTQGIYSSRRIARACETRVDFMAVTAMQKPDFRTISDFRLRHLAALGGLFGQVLRLCQKAGMVKLGHVALDGTKVKANASKHKAMSYERMKKTAKELQAVVEQWFVHADAEDAAEDKEYGRGRRGDELPGWVADKAQRLLRIQEAMSTLEAEAKAQLVAGVKPAPETKPPDDGGSDKPPRSRRRKRPSKSGEPHPKAQLNFTDADSKILKGPNGFMQGYNCQAAVDAKAQVIVAHSTVNEQGDAPQLISMVKQIRDNVGRNPAELSADSGYLSEENLKALHRRRITAYIATGRQKPGKKSRTVGPLGRAMRTKLARAGFRSRYRMRKHTVEPVFGQMKDARQFRGMMLRGMKKVPHEWAMLCTAHNLLKLARR
jgi:transposase